MELIAKSMPDAPAGHEHRTTFAGVSGFITRRFRLPTSPLPQAGEGTNGAASRAVLFGFETKPSTRAWRPAASFLSLVLAAGAALAQVPDALPWEVPETSKRSSGPNRVAATSVELLRTFGIDDQQLSEFQDGAALESGEAGVLHRILFRLPRLTIAQLEADAPADWQPKTLIARSSAARGHSFLIQGRAQRLDTIAIPPASPLRLEFEKYYRVEIVLDKDNHPAVLWTRQVPSAWRAAGALDEPIAAHGLFMKHGGGGRLPIHFAASRLAWYPSKVADVPRITPSEVYLASRGMDVALFDDVRPRNRKPIEAEDRECFYRLLAAIGPGWPPDGDRQLPPALEIGPLLQNPSRYHGDLMTVRGTVKRITKVVVDDAEIRNRLGLAEYYQLDTFVPLKNQLIKFRTAERPDESPVFTESYPVTICVLDLPPDLSEGDDVRAEIRTTAAFFKLWAYNTRYVASFGSAKPQLGPMLIGATPVVIPLAGESRSARPLFLGIIFLLLLGAIWLAAWRAGRGDQAFAGTILKRIRQNRS